MHEFAEFCDLSCSLRFQSMMVYSSYKKQQILYYYLLGVKALNIVEHLHEERLSCHDVGKAKFLPRF